MTGDGAEEMSMNLLAVARRISSAPLGAVDAYKQEIIQVLLAAAEAREPSARRHAMAVAHHSRRIAEQMGLEREHIRVIQCAALVHDIGKIGIPERILNKPSALTDDEFEIMQRHPRIGAEILGRVSMFAQEAPLVLHHHERFDGQGYPVRLCGGDIPLGARIISVADALDVMLTPRCYKPAYAMNTARNELIEQSGRQFDGDVVDAALAWLSAMVRDPQAVALSSGD